MIFGEDLLKRLGLEELEPSVKRDLLSALNGELELRVGTALSDGMTNAQMEEFESFIDRDKDGIAAWLRDFAPDFMDDPILAELESAAGATEDPLVVIAEFASLKWLQIHRPDYREVVAREQESLEAELKEKAPEILKRASG